MTCASCGSPATGGLCRDCELAQRYEADVPDTFDTDADDDVRTDGGAVVADDPAEETLELTDEGVEMPAFLRGYVGTFTLRTAAVTGELETTESGLPDADVVDTVFAVYPDDDGDHNPYLRSGLMSFETPEHREVIYEVVDRRGGSGGAGE